MGNELKGRKRLPEHIREVKGTNRKDRSNPDAPVASADAPRPPAWLSSRRAVEHFGVLRTRIEDLGVASKTDTELLALAATRLAEIEECDELIAEHGRLIESNSTKGGLTLRANPAVGQRNEAFRHLQSLLAEFGLTPAARSKIVAPKSGKQQNPFAKVGGGGK
jgi:P27 family predicted phage terminase small subunit